jgi:hypothetical protein
MIQVKHSQPKDPAHPGGVETTLPTTTTLPSPLSPNVDEIDTLHYQAVSPHTQMLENIQVDAVHTVYPKRIQES